LHPQPALVRHRHHFRPLPCLNRCSCCLQHLLHRILRQHCRLEEPEELLLDSGRLLVLEQQLHRFMPLLEYVLWNSLDWLLGLDPVRSHPQRLLDQQQEPQPSLSSQSSSAWLEEPSLMLRPSCPWQRTLIVSRKPLPCLCFCCLIWHSLHPSFLWLPCLLILMILLFSYPITWYPFLSSSLSKRSPSSWSLQSSYSSSLVPSSGSYRPRYPSCTSACRSRTVPRMATSQYQ